MRDIARTRLLALSAAVVAATAFSSSTAAADAAAGEKLFKRCSACHSLEAGKKKVGPSLAGIIGRTAGTSEGYKYSRLNKDAGDAGLVWTEETIAAYLPDPSKYLKNFLTEKGMADKAKGRTKMTFKMAKEDQRAAIAAYLASLQ